MEFGDKVKLTRKKVGLTQMQLAKELMIGTATLIRWEKGQTIPHNSLKMLFETYCKSKGIKMD